VQGGTFGVLLDGLKADNTTSGWLPQLMLRVRKLIVSSWHEGPAVIRLLRAALALS